MQDKEDNRFDKWDNYTDMDLAEMWFDSRGIYNTRTKIDDEWVVMITVDMAGEEHDILLHKGELESRADEWRYENE